MRAPALRPHLRRDRRQVRHRVIRLQPETAEVVGQLAGDTDKAFATLRDLARGIYPPLLTAEGLPAALQAHAAKAALPVAVHADGITLYDQQTEAAVYFCCLEALQNTAKYARATHATVTLADTDGQLEFTVADDGVGFDPATTPRGSGLTNMADRLDAHGGSLTIDSASGAGTKITGRLPARIPQPALPTPASERPDGIRLPGLEGLSFALQASRGISIPTKAL